MQGETQGNEFTSNVPQNESSKTLSEVAGQENIARMADQQALVHLHPDKTLAQISDQSLAQLSNDTCMPQTSSAGGPSPLCGHEGLHEMSSQGVLHDMARQEHLHQIPPPEVMSNISAQRDLSEVPSHMPKIQDSQGVIDISAPEVRTRIRSQEEEIVVLQSTFTQTLPISEDRKKVCHSVAVQTQFNADYEAQTYSVITGDGGVSYDSDGVRVLRAIGTWTPNYQGNEQFVEQNSEVYLNGSGTVSSPDNSLIQHSVSSSPNSAANCMSSTTANREISSNHVHALHDDQDPNGANKLAGGDKAFVCPVCSKGLARKDKLVIHMRIHTGEKPYVCEVCERAFARRDKLVMHMNKLKHITPTNIAPLGKRQHHQSASGLSVLPEKRQDMKLESQEMGSPASSVDIQPATLVQVVHEQPTMTWNCELCGRICMSREEWTAHARSHLDGDTNFGSPSVGSSLSVLTPLSSYQYAAAPSDKQTCFVCRQEFPSKTDLILHLRTHFVGKPELLANHIASLTDSSGVC